MGPTTMRKIGQENWVINKLINNGTEHLAKSQGIEHHSRTGKFDFRFYEN